MTEKLYMAINLRTDISGIIFLANVATISEGDCESIHNSCQNSLYIVGL